MSLCSNAHLLRTSPVVLVLVIWWNTVSLANGQTDTNQNASLYFENLYTIAFPGDRLERFLECLCDGKKKLCRHRYNLVTVLQYEADDLIETEDISAGDATGNTFICHPGRFAPTDSVSCVRSSNAFSWCEGQTFCQPAYVNTSYSACDLSCVNMEWIATAFSGRNFTDQPEIVDGSCPATSEIPQTTAQTSPQTTAQTSPQTTTQTSPQTTAQTSPQTTTQTSLPTTTQTSPQTTAQTSPQTITQTSPQTTTQISPKTIIQTSPPTTTQSDSTQTSTTGQMQAEGSSDSGTLEIIAGLGWALACVLILIIVILLFLIYRLKRAGAGKTQKEDPEGMRSENNSQTAVGTTGNKQSPAGNSGGSTTHAISNGRNGEALGVFNNRYILEERAQKTRNCGEKSPNHKNANPKLGEVLREFDEKPRYGLIPVAPPLKQASHVLAPNSNLDHKKETGPKEHPWNNRILPTPRETTDSRAGREKTTDNPNSASGVPAPVAKVNPLAQLSASNIRKVKQQIDEGNARAVSETRSQGGNPWVDS